MVLLWVLCFPFSEDLREEHLVLAACVCDQTNQMIDARNSSYGFLPFLIVSKHELSRLSLVFSKPSGQDTCFSSLIFSMDWIWKMLNPGMVWRAALEVEMWLNQRLYKGESAGDFDLPQLAEINLKCRINFHFMFLWQPTWHKQQLERAMNSTCLWLGLKSEQILNHKYKVLWFIKNINSSSTELWI